MKIGRIDGTCNGSRRQNPKIRPKKMHFPGYLISGRTESNLHSTVYHTAPKHRPETKLSIAQICMVGIVGIDLSLQVMATLCLSVEMFVRRDIFGSSRRLLLALLFH
jgi:hypothetical protein